MQDLNDMMVFLAVVETGSFTLAAERLAMPKANVSRKVTKLESTLGVTLLERTTRRHSGFTKFRGGAESQNFFPLIF